MNKQSQEKVPVLPRTLRVQLGRRHILHGEPQICATCPLALAFRDALSDVEERALFGFPVIDVWVTLEYAGVYVSSVHNNPSCGVRATSRRIGCYKLPKSAILFVQQVDAGKAVGPFEFEATLYGDAVTEADVARAGILQ